MNFLAHAYLSGEDEGLLIGNFIADFVKGKVALERYSKPIKRGILLHRAIDAFTDVHPQVTLSKNRLRPKYRHYSAVIVDVFYDHFLAKLWNEFHPLPLTAFVSEVYSVISSNHELLPESVKIFFPYMVKGNWLVNYARIEGIDRSLTGMSRRTPYLSKMEEASNELIKHGDEFEEEFRTFFPELRNHVKRILDTGAG